MGRRAPLKCIKCASLTVEEAIALHGSSGTGERCWNPSVCHRRRSHYRHRDEVNRKRRKRHTVLAAQDPDSLNSPSPHSSSSPSSVVQSDAAIAVASTSNALIEVDVLPEPATISAVLVMYQAGVDAPLHAIGAKVWQGNQKRAVIKPVHCLEMRSPQIKEYIAKEMLPLLHQHFGITAFERDYKVLSPKQCPLDPCPLKDMS